jgi:hypothetical protein
MTLISLPDGKHVGVNAHGGKAWLTAYNGQGVVLPLDKSAAIRLRAALLRAIHETEKQA